MSIAGVIVNILARLTGGALSGGEVRSAPAVGRAELRRRLVEAVSPMLKANGFGRFEGNIARRQCAAWVDVFQLRFDVNPETHGYGVVVEIGRHFLLADIRMSFGAVTRRNGQVWPGITECHLRKSLQRRRRQAGNKARNVWRVGPNGEWLEETVSEVTQLLEEEVLPWFVWVSDLSRVLDLIQQKKFDIEGKSSDAMLRGMHGYTHGWARAVLGAFLAFHLQRWEQCIALIEPVLARGGTLGYRDQLIPLDRESLQRLQQLQDAARAATAAA